VDTDEFEVVINPHCASGQASSLVAGINALPEYIDGVVVALGDQPLVPPWLLDQLAAAFDPAVHDAVRPRYADGPGNPILLSRTLFPELVRLTGDVGAREVLRAHADRIYEIDFTSRPAPRDVDTMDDYAALLLDWSASGSPTMPRYCQRCAAEVGVRDAYGRNRPVCPACGFVYFYDPKISVVTVIDLDGRIVLQQRAGEPGKGKWTFPGGFADRGEPLEVAAAREVEEEVGLVVEDLELLTVLSNPGETVVLVVYSATAHGQEPALGPESTDVGRFTLDRLPELAFRRDPLILDAWRAHHR
jgi:ADP-ribose pyrophosphatase YjhB (NUDIX family)